MGPTRHPTRAIRGQAPRGQDTMQVGVMVQLLTPGVEDGEAADLGSEMLGVPGDVLERLSDRAKEQPIEEARVLERQRPEGMRQGKDHMAVGGLEDLALPGGEPRGLGRAVTFGTAAVAAGVIRLRFVSTVVALRDMASESSGTAEGDGPQGPVLLAREGLAIAGQKRGAMLVHHIGHFQRRPTHGSVSRSAGNARASKGLSVAWSAGWATWR